MNEKINLQTDNNVYVNSEVSVRGLVKRVIYILPLLLFAYSVIIYVYASHNTLFAERYTMTVSASLRELLAAISCIFPFSIAESVVIIGVPAVVILFIRALVLQLAYKKKRTIVLFLLRSICVLLVAISVFINTFGICYKRVPVSEQLGIDTDNITSNDVYITACIVSDLLSEYCVDVPRISSGESVMPYGFDEMVDKICEGYRNILLYMPDSVSVKPVASSEIWAYTHISGMYFPFTGESNINVSFPDYIVAYTTAHELAHQFGFAGEDDANMLAFFACMYSGDDYLAYSALMSAFEYLISDMPPYMTNQVFNAADRRIIEEFSAYLRFMKSHTNETVTKMSSKVNDVYLKTNGVEQGTANYRNVSKLITGFFKQNYPEYFER